MLIEHVNSLGSSNDGIRPGTFNVIVGTDDGTGKITYKNVEITIDEDTALGDIAGLVADINDDADGFTVTAEDGYLQFKPTGDTYSLAFETIDLRSSSIASTTL